MKIPQPILLLFMLRPRGFQDFLRGGTLLFSRGRLWWSRRGKPPCNPYFSPRWTRGDLQTEGEAAAAAAAAAAASIIAEDDEI